MFATTTAAVAAYFARRAQRTLRQRIAVTLGTAAVVAGLSGSLMAYGAVTGNPDTVEWPTGNTAASTIGGEH